MNVKVSQLKADFIKGIVQLQTPLTCNSVFFSKGELHVFTHMRDIKQEATNGQTKTHRHRQQSSGYLKGREGRGGQQGQGGQIHSDRRTEYTDVTLQSCTPEVYITLLAKVPPIN